MKLHTMKKGLYSSIFLSVLMGSAFAGSGMMAPTASPGRFYVGVFGGGGSSNEFDINQFGTAFYFEAAGGPLAVNAFGSVNSHSTWLAGGQAGFQAQDVVLDLGTPLQLAPAIELEAYALGNSSFTGNLSNNTARLPEHDFVVSYPMERSVYLANFVLGLGNPCWMFHPYVGLGFGGAIVEISGADATQVAPPEIGVNHYNANTSDTAPTFAGQVKVGLSYDVTPCISLFAEYRWLYLSSTHFAFGSTVYPAHPATSYWQVTLGPQQYNFGAAGIRFTL